jgi:hypothetical protein
VELLEIALGGLTGLVVGALAGAAAFQSEIVALAGSMGGAIFGLIAALKRIEGEDGRGRLENVAQAPAPDTVRPAGADPRLPRRSAA